MELIQVIMMSYATALQEVGSGSTTNDLEAGVTAGVCVVAPTGLAVMKVPSLPPWRLLIMIT